MNIFVYSDESGVFDVVHNDFYVYGGIVFLDKSDRDNANIKYLSIERNILRVNPKYKNKELKANILKNSEKMRLFKSVNVIKFGVLIEQKKVMKSIFKNKKTKQRYLDYAFKKGLENCFYELIKKGRINKNEVENIYIFCDEHTTATSGMYELGEMLEQTFKIGTYTENFDQYIPPLFNKLKVLKINYCNSEKQAMIRLSDIVANYIYNEKVKTGNIEKLKSKIYIKEIPEK